jgi:hypothetical protein
MELRPHSLTAALWPNGIRSLIRKTRFLPVLSFQCSTPVGNTRRQPKSCFGENQLLRNSISFSLLTTSHPMVLYGQPVRASTTYYSRFTLLMASSSRFGSYPYPNCRAIHARFHCASVGLPLRQGIKVHSPAHSSIGTPSPRRAPTPCRCMVSDLFHSPLRGSFHLSLTVLVHYRSSRIFSLTS